MKNIYKKIEKAYAPKESSEPSWVEELREELKEIKALLHAQKRVVAHKKRRKSQAYFDFVKLFRERLMPDTEKGIYPEVHYQGKRIGVNLKGFLYDKATTKSLKAYEAFALYEYFYAKKEQIDAFIVVD
jgi:hypothetical protein